MKDCRWLHADAHRQLPAARWTTARRRLVATVVVAAGLLLGSLPAQARGPTVITDIVVSQDTDGSTLVRVTGNASFRSGTYRTYHIFQAPPREVLRIEGIKDGYRPYQIPVDDGNLVRIRVGHHPEHDPPELHLVFDLFSNAVHITGVSLEEEQLLVRFAGGRPAKSSPPPRRGTPSTPVPTTPPRPTVAAPTPTASPSPTPPPAPTPLPTRTPRARPRPVATSSPALPPPAGPGTMAARPVVRYSAPSSTADDGQDARTRYRRKAATTISEIVTSNRPDGATLVRITTDGDLVQRALRHRLDPDDHTLYVFLVPDLELADSPIRVAIGEPNLVEIELTQLPTDGSPELRIALRLSSEQVSVDNIAVLGRNMVFVLAPPTTP